jgi:hypothetical protein
MYNKILPEDPAVRKDFEDKTKEFDDPGMFALSKLCEIF